MLKRNQSNSKLKLIRLRSGKTRYEIFMVISRANMSSFLYDKEKNIVLKSISTMSKDFAKNKNRRNKSSAQILGVKFADILKNFSIDNKDVYFNKGSYKFHGVVKSFYDSIFN